MANLELAPNSSLQAPPVQGSETAALAVPAGMGHAGSW